MTRRSWFAAILAALAGFRKSTVNPPDSYLTPAMARQALAKLRQARDEPPMSFLGDLKMVNPTGYWNVKAYVQALDRIHEVNS
jgi:hypothetical protein